MASTASSGTGGLLTKAAVAFCLLALLTSACNSTTVRGSTGSSLGDQRGGTLRLIMPAWTFSDLANPNPQATALDPQAGPFLDSQEFFRCCLLRTLLSYAGRPSRDGGAELRPDLATELPQESADGLTWTFHLRAGLRYAPPFQHTEIAAADIIRGVERDARLEGPSLFSIIEGFDQYAKGALLVTGLEAPDHHSLRVHLTRRFGALPYLFSLPETAPIPPNPFDQSNPLGTATGHDDGYGRFLVASGPYMIEGSERLNFSVPPPGQRPLEGFVPGKSLTLVRNPSWSEATDSLRRAYVNRIVVTIGGTLDEAGRRLDTGQEDLIILASPPIQAPSWLIDRYKNNPRIGHVYAESRDTIRLMTMNLVMPPFDDIHVRRAVNYIIDKKALLDLRGPFAGQIAGHLVPDSLENGALANYDPYPTESGNGSLKMASNEMRQSRYDPGHVGRCDAPECKQVRALMIGTSQNFAQFSQQAAIIREDLSKLGITLLLEHPTDGSAFTKLEDPAHHVALGLNIAGGKDIFSASTIFEAYDSSSIGSSDEIAHLGATPDQLAGWGYHITSVPSIDDRIHQCLDRVGDAEAQCWTSLDVYLMEKVVPDVPITFENVVEVVPTRIAHYSFDQFANLPALDQIAIKS